MIKRPMLACKYDPARVHWPMLASAKLDGVRCLIGPDGPVSRTLKPIPNKFIQAQLSRPELIGLDGELCVGPASARDLMQRTTSGVMSVEGEPDFTFRVFDYFGHLSTPFYSRSNKAREMCRELNLKHVIYHWHVTIFNEDELAQFESSCLNAGYEGVILRDPHGVYKTGRSTEREGGMIKVKRFSDAEAVILSIQPLMHNDNPATINALGLTERSTHQSEQVAQPCLGSLTVRDIETGVIFSIGSGFTEAQRYALWELRPNILGKVITYKHFPVSGTKDKPRFPIFKSFRDLDDRG